MLLCTAYRFRTSFHSLLSFEFSDHCPWLLGLEIMALHKSIAEKLKSFLIQNNHNIVHRFHISSRNAKQKDYISCKAPSIRMSQTNTDSLLRSNLQHLKISAKKTYIAKQASSDAVVLDCSCITTGGVLLPGQSGVAWMHQNKAEYTEKSRNHLEVLCCVPFSMFLWGISVIKARGMRFHIFEIN